MSKQTFRETFETIATAIISVASVAFVAVGTFAMCAPGGLVA